MRARAALPVALTAAVTLAAAAVAQAPAPSGNFGGGALVAPPRDHFGAGNALPDRKLEIEATIRGSCGGGEIAADATVADDGSFSAHGTQRTSPAPKEQITTTFKLTGTFSTPTSADGTISATLKRRAGGATKRCRSGSVQYSVRRPDGQIGAPGAPQGARYFGTTSQRGVGPRRPIVLRISDDGLVISRALFGESVRCSDDTQAAALEAPSTNAAIDSRGRVDDHERFSIHEGTAVVKVNDSFTAEIGEAGARGTFSLNDRTTDGASGRTLRTCHSGVVTWTAAP